MKPTQQDSTDITTGLVKKMNSKQTATVVTVVKANSKTQENLDLDLFKRWSD